jgi:predicted O-methyltransferase YrrM
LHTFEVLPEKVKLVQETFRLAEVEDQIELIFADARRHLAAIPKVAFCFLDAEKEIYDDCYDLMALNS